MGMVIIKKFTSNQLPTHPPSRWRLEKSHIVLKNAVLSYLLLVNPVLENLLPTNYCVKKCKKFLLTVTRYDFALFMKKSEFGVNLFLFPTILIKIYSLMSRYLLVFFLLIIIFSKNYFFNVCKYYCVAPRRAENKVFLTTKIIFDKNQFPKYIPHG